MKYATFEAVLSNGADQVTVRNLLQELVPTEVQAEVVRRFDAVLTEREQRRREREADLYGTIGIPQEEFFEYGMLGELHHWTGVCFKGFGMQHCGEYTLRSFGQSLLKFTATLTEQEQEERKALFGAAKRGAEFLRSFWEWIGEQCQGEPEKVAGYFENWEEARWTDSLVPTEKIPLPIREKFCCANSALAQWRAFQSRENIFLIRHTKLEHGRCFMELEVKREKSENRE